MKKYLLMIAAASSLMLAACSGGSTTSTGNPDSAQVAIAQPAQPDASLAELVAQAKAEGVNWTIEQWQQHTDKVLRAYKPFAVALDEISTKIAKGDGDAQQLIKQSEEVEKLYPDYDKLIREFTQAAEATPNGKTVIADEQWVAGKMQELGVPKL